MPAFEDMQDMLFATRINNDTNTYTAATSPAQRASPAMEEDEIDDDREDDAIHDNVQVDTYTD